MTMRDKFCLFIIVGKAAFLTTLGVFVLGVLAFKIALTPAEQGILGAAVAFLPTGIAAWWIFRKLQAYRTRREARAVAIAFAVLNPVSLGIAILLSQLSGGYAELFLGSPFGLVGALVGTVVMATLLDFALCLFTLSITRQIIRLESTH
jgi:hypothetical protein